MSRFSVRPALLAVACAAFLQMVPFAPARAAAPAAVLPSFSGLVEAAEPAVVTIETASRAADAQLGEAPDSDTSKPALRNFFRHFFGGGHPKGTIPLPEGDGQGALSLGSGFIIDPSGIIVTNFHVIEGADKITVILDDGTELGAELVASDEKTDVSVLRVNAGRRLPTVRWGDSSGVKVGDWAIAIGNPFGLGASVSVGVISGKGRSINAGPYDDYFQIDAPINRGNSGGPLFDQQGRVIGINSAIFSPSGGNVGIGFAIPANQARAIVQDLLDDGVVERGWLGVSIQQVTPAVAESMGLARATGAMVAAVNEGGPAARGGVQRGDIILEFDGKPIETVRDLTRTVAETAPGRRAHIRLLRGGDERTLTVETGRYPS